MLNFIILHENKHEILKQNVEWKFKIQIIIGILSIYCYLFNKIRPNSIVWLSNESKSGYIYHIDEKEGFAKIIQI